MKGKPDPLLYEHGRERLAALERLGGQGQLQIFYGDETHLCSEGYVPYGWQFKEEQVCTEVEKKFRLNVFGLVSRDNVCHWASTSEKINAEFIARQLDSLSIGLELPTVAVLDNASVHRAKVIRERRSIWEQRGLYLFFLPPYSPHLNITETLWRHLKGGWLNPQDYATADDLAYALNRCLHNVGKSLKIKFSPFNAN